MYAGAYKDVTEPVNTHKKGCMLHMQSLGLKPTCLEVGSFGFLLLVQVYVCVSADLARYTLDFVRMDNTHRALDIHNDNHNDPLANL